MLFQSLFDPFLLLHSAQPRSVGRFLGRDSFFQPLLSDYLWLEITDIFEALEVDAFSRQTFLFLLLVLLLPGVL